MYRAGFRRDNVLKVSLVTTAAMLAICLLAFVETTNTARATSLPQNGKLAFSSSIDGSIYTVEPDGSNLGQLTEGSYPTWSPDGTEIAFSHPGSVGEHILVMSADGSNATKFHKVELAGSFPTWSPDGTKLAFSDGDIYIMDPAGHTFTDPAGFSYSQIPLTNTTGQYESFPAFSPNGSQMCFFRYKFTGPPPPDPGFYVMDADGSDPTLLFEDVPSGGSGAGCDWSPDGSKIIFHSAPFSVSATEELAKLDEDVYVMNADGSGQTALTSNSAADVAPDWSPDGKKITFASDRDGDFEIYTMDADGSDIVQVTKNSGWTTLIPTGSRCLSPRPRRFTHRTQEAHPCCWWRAPYSSPGVSCSMRR